MFCIAQKNHLVFISLVSLSLFPLWFLLGPVLKFCPIFHMHIYVFLSLCEYCTLDLILDASLIHGGTINVLMNKIILVHFF